MNKLSKYAIETLHFYMRFENTYHSSDRACDRLERAVNATVKDVNSCDWIEVTPKQRENAIYKLYDYAADALRLYEGRLLK